MEWTAFTAPGMELEGLSAATLAALVRVHIDTVRRWKRSGRLPAHVAELVQLKTRGDLGLLDPAWRGWHLLRGALWSPENEPAEPGQVRAIPYRAAQLAELERQARQPRQWELFEESALPDSLVEQLLARRAG